MKKYILILLPLFFLGCKKDYNAIVDPPQTLYQAVSVYSADSFIYSPADSLFKFQIVLSGVSNINSVSYDIFGPDNMTVNSSPLALTLQGASSSDTGSYAASFPMSQSYPSGNYEIKFYVTDNNGNTSTIAVHSFKYNNGFSASLILSNLVCPDTVTVGSTTIQITLSVTVKDSAGLSDVQSVFFNSYIPPDGHPSSSNPFIMYDDGDLAHGDQVAGDGIYSLIVNLPPSAPKGTFRWEFQAKNYSGEYSNKIIHYVVVK